MNFFPLKRLSSDLLWIIFGQVTAQFAVIAGVKILTNLLPRADYGHFALGVSVAGAVSVLIFGPLGQVVYRYYAICENSKTLLSYYNLLRRIHMLLCCVFFSVALMASFFVPEESRHYQFGLFAGGLVGLSASIQTYFTARQLRKYAAVIQTFENLLKYLLPVVVILFVVTSGTMALLGFVAAEIIVAILAIKMLLKSGAAGARDENPVEQKELAMKFWNFGWPFVGFSLLAMFYNYGDRWILDYFGGPAVVASYAVLFQIAFAPSALVLGIVNQLYLPKIYVALANKTLTESAITEAVKLERRAAVLMLLSCVVSTIAALGFAELIVTVFASNSYAEYAGMLWLFVISHHIIAYTQVASSIGFGMNKPNLYLSPKIFQLIIMIAAGSVLIRPYGVRGMIVVFVLGAAVNLLVTTIKNIQLLQNARKGLRPMDKFSDVCTE